MFAEDGHSGTTAKLTLSIYLSNLHYLKLKARLVKMMNGMMLAAPVAKLLQKINEHLMYSKMRMVPIDIDGKVFWEWVKSYDDDGKTNRW
jgi:hypothetical protein